MHTSILHPYCDISNPGSILCKATPEHAIAVANLLLGSDMGIFVDDLMQSGDIDMVTQVGGMGNQQRSFEKEGDLLASIYCQSASRLYK